jgi:hypothetical protein
MTDGDEEGHILKHWLTHHGGEGKPSFRIKIVKTYRDALSRQIGEAIRMEAIRMEAIRMELRGNVLNSQAIFRRCRIPSLVVDRSWMAETEKAREEQKETSKNSTKNREILEEGISELDRTAMQGQKRTSKELHVLGGAPKRRRKLEHKKEREDWGEAPSVVEEAKLEFLHSRQRTV